MTTILMPALSPTMEEGTLAKWHVRPGDAITAGDVIAEIETDKATMEVEAADDGVIAYLLVPAGTEGVKVNTPIAQLAGEGGAAPRAPEAEALPVPAVETLAASPPQAETPAVAPQTRRLASPLARRMAELAQIDLASLTGSGPHGRIVKADVEAARPGAPPVIHAPMTYAPVATAPALRPTRSLEEMGVAPGTYDLVPLDGMRRTIARRMTDSFRDIPHFPLSLDIEIDALLATRAKINGLLEPRGVKVSVNDLVIKACAVALTRVPEANASYTPEGIAMHHHADIAVAVAIPGGLITPIVRAADTKGVAQIAIETKDLAERARSRALAPREFQGGTFSVSNLGMFGIRSFASILNEPQGAILSVGAGERRPVVRGDAVEIATVMSVTLTCDHRALDGAVGARWLQAFKGLVEDPLTMIV